jgi:hypothetical protein
MVRARERKLQNIWPVFITLLLTITALIAFKRGGLVDQVRDWRHGRSIDKTDEWQEFKKAFEVQK